MAKFLYSSVHHKPNNAFAIIFIINTLIIIAAIGILIYNYLIFGPRDRVVKLYINGLKTNNFSLIKGVSAKEYNSDKEIGEELQKYSGIDFAIHGGYRASTTNGLQVNTTIYGMKGIKPCKHEITLIGMGDAWYLVKGDLKDEYNRKDTNGSSK